MKKLVLLSVVTLVSAASGAQSSFDDEVNRELDTMYQQNHTTNVQSATQGVPRPAQLQAQQVTPPNVQVNVQSAVQKQPTTVIEATPLTESRVERMRKARMDSELQTEQKIVEKLELSRIEDERRRSDALFGDKFSQLQNQQAAPAQPPVVMAQAPVAPAEVIVKQPEQEKSVDRDAIHEEVTAALEEDKLKNTPPTKQTYMSLLGGMGLYNNQNIQSQYAAGFGVGQKIRDHLLAEIDFLYSDYKVTLPFQTVTYNYGYLTYTPVTQDMKQYQGLGELKYAFFDGSLRPELGFAAAYSYRSYTGLQTGLSSFSSTSNAIDLGIVAGVSFDVMENFGIGFEGKYMWNMYNQTQSNNGTTGYYNTGNSVTPESLGYFLVGVTGRILF